MGKQVERDIENSEGGRKVGNEVRMDVGRK